MGSLRQCGARGRLARAFAFATVGLAAAAVGLVAPGTAAADRGMIVGASDDAMKWHTTDAIDVGSALSLQAFRITLPWHRGQTSLSAANVGVLNDVTFRGAQFRPIVSVYSDDPSEAPTTAADRDDYCTYVRSVLARYPQINDVVVWNEPNHDYFWRPQFDAAGQSAAPAAYEALLARCYDMLHAFRPGVNVIAPATSPRGSDNPWATKNVSHSPVSFILEMGRAYRDSGRQRPIFDTVGHHPHPDIHERPWKVHDGSNQIALGDWSKLMDTLREAFGGTGQPIPGEDGVTIWYLEVGFQSTVPLNKGYTGVENDVGALPDYVGGEPERRYDADSPAPDQATQIVDAMKLAYCEPYVGAYLNFLLWDETELSGWQSGVLYADGTRKRSWEPFERALVDVLLDRVDCSSLKGGPAPGRAAPAAGGGGAAGGAAAPAAGIAQVAAPSTRGVATTKVAPRRRTFLSFRGSRSETFGFASVGAMLAEATRAGTPRRPLAHRLVRFRVDGHAYTARTNRRGVVILPIGPTLLPGSFLVRIDFRGEPAELPAHAVARIAIRNSGARVRSPGEFRTRAGAGRLDVGFQGRFCGALSFDTQNVRLRTQKLRALGVSPDGADAWISGVARSGALFVAHARARGGKGAAFELWLGGASRTGRGSLVSGKIVVSQAIARGRGGSRARHLSAGACPSV